MCLVAVLLCYSLCHVLLGFFFFFIDTATTEIYTLSLHDALPISWGPRRAPRHRAPGPGSGSGPALVRCGLPGRFSHRPRRFGPTADERRWPRTRRPARPGAARPPPPVPP